jgi:hypothetical protein
MMITVCSKIWLCCWAANQDGQGIPNRGDAQLLEAGILMNNLLSSTSANEGSTDSTGVPVPTILAAVGANHRTIEMASLALSIGVQHLIPLTKNSYPATFSFGYSKLCLYGTSKCASFAFSSEISIWWVSKNSRGHVVVTYCGLGKIV